MYLQNPLSRAGFRLQQIMESLTLNVKQNNESEIEKQVLDHYVKTLIKNSFLRDEMNVKKNDRMNSKNNKRKFQAKARSKEHLLPEQNETKFTTLFFYISRYRLTYPLCECI